jgi:iron complex outermembrane receptor protein
VADFIDVTDVGDPDGPTGPLKPARTYENVDASFVGFELGSELALPFDLFARASLSYVRGDNEDDNRPLSEIPPLKGSVALRYDDDRFFVEAAENFADNQDRVDSSLNEDETESWYTTDVKAGYRHSRFSVYAGVNNVFDKFYYTHLSYQRDPFASGYKVPENGRNYYVTATVEL